MIRPLLASVLFAGLSCVARAEAPLPFRDPALPLESRVQDLLQRLTVEEKAGLMKNVSEPVPRLGIPAYDWWNEALHGVARAGEATVFPQAIGLAATWDTALLHQVGDVIATEGRAIYHEAQRQNNFGRYLGLTYWSPNINLFRDPRWGRGQETYGEDPFLTAEMGVAFVKGLQGSDPRYLKAAATAKHFAVHSGPESIRYSMDLHPSETDLHDSYLPAFEALVKEAKVESVMTAYSSLWGEPATLNRRLYRILYQDWGFDGHVVSDCGAVYCLASIYKVATDYADAEAKAIRAGLCLRCGDGNATLAEGVARGLLTEAELDQRLAQLLRTQMRLGMFDPNTAVPYSTIPVSAIHQPDHQALALEAAERSIVLLKNDGLLPLDPSAPRRLLVTGPNAASVPALLGNYHGTPVHPITVVEGLRQLLPSWTIHYAKGCDYVDAPAGWHTVPRTALHSGT